jgi:hypothetical protein
VNECGCTKICNCGTVEFPTVLCRAEMQNGSGEVPEPHQREHQSELAILLATLTLASATLLAASPGLIRLVLLSTLMATALLTTTLLTTLVLLVHAFV